MRTAGIQFEGTRIGEHRAQAAQPARRHFLSIHISVAMHWALRPSSGASVCSPDSLLSFAVSPNSRTTSICSVPSRLPQYTRQYRHSSTPYRDLVSRATGIWAEPKQASKAKNKRKKWSIAVNCASLRRQPLDQILSHRHATSGAVKWSEKETIDQQLQQHLSGF